MTWSGYIMIKPNWLLHKFSYILESIIMDIWKTLLVITDLIPLFLYFFKWQIDSKVWTSRKSWVHFYSSMGVFYETYYIVLNKCSLHVDRHPEETGSPNGQQRCFSAISLGLGVYSIKTWVWVVRKSYGRIHSNRSIYSALYGMIYAYKGAPEYVKQVPDGGGSSPGPTLSIISACQYGSTTNIFTPIYLLIRRQMRYRACSAIVFIFAVWGVSQQHPSICTLSADHPLVATAVTTLLMAAQLQKHLQLNEIWCQ